MEPTHKSLSHGERAGLVATVVVGFASVIPAFSLFLFLLYRVLRPGRRAIYPISIFYLSLLFWDVVVELGWIVNIRWIYRGQIETGAYCVTQALIQQLGATGTSLSIMAMSWCILHDYVIDSSTSLGHWAGVIGVGIISLIQFINLIVPNLVLGGAYRYYGIAGFWCWIAATPNAKAHFAMKIVTEYLFFWVAFVFSLLTAIAYFIRVKSGVRLPAGFLWIGFPIRGNRLFRLGLISFDSNLRGRPKWSFSLDLSISGRTVSIMLPIPMQYFSQYAMEMMPREGRQSGSVTPTRRSDSVDQTTGPTYEMDRNSTFSTQDSASHNVNKKYATRLLLFPLSYLVVIGPLSIARFLQFAGIQIQPGVTAFVASFFTLVGLIDVLLFIVAGPSFGVDFSK